MNEQLQQLAAQGFGTALQYLQATEVFVAEQTPLLVQEVLMFGLAKAILFTSIWVVLLLMIIVLAWYLCKKFYVDDGDGELIVFILFLGSIPAFCLFAGACNQILTICKIVFAPRLYLIEQFKQLMN